MSSPGNSSVYVGDLAEGATEHHLHQVFSQAGEIHSVRRCRQTGREALSYGYVNYVWPEDAQRAIQTLNHVSICGRRVRLMWSQRDGSARKSGVGNVFVKNLHPDLVDIKVLHDHFKPYGKILSTKVATDRDGVSRKYGFVQFEDPDAATQAIEALDKTDLCGQTLEVAPFIPAKDRASEPGKFCNVYVKNLGNQVDLETLKSAFVQFGPVSSAVVMRNNRGHSRGFGFVNFENPEDAARAVAGMDNYAFEGQTWKVDRAQRRESTGDKCVRNF